MDVHNYLVEHDAPHEVFPARGRLRFPERIASILDLPPEEVGKVIIFESPSSPVAAIIPAGRDPDPTLVGKAARRGSLQPATNDRASELTGYLAESIPPAGLPEDFVVVVDRSFDRDAVLYFAGGEARAVLKIRGKDLVRATSARVAPILLAGPRAKGRDAR